MPRYFIYDRRYDPVAEFDSKQAAARFCEVGLTGFGNYLNKKRLVGRHGFLAKTHKVVKVVL